MARKIAVFASVLLALQLCVWAPVALADHSGHDHGDGALTPSINSHVHQVHLSGLFCSISVVFLPVYVMLCGQRFEVFCHTFLSGNVSSLAGPVRVSFSFSRSD